jgi:hypothetical protein
VPRKPLGVYSRNTPDWFITGMYGQAGFQPAVAANFSYVCLYNNATDGSFLVVHGLWLFVGTGNAVLEKAFGTHGSAGAVGNPLAFENPNGFGQIYTATSTTCFGTEFGTCGGAAIPYQWPHEWPVCRVQPGWMLAVHTDTVNQALNCSFAWWVSNSG